MENTNTKSGKFIITISATTFKSEIVSESFYLDEISDDIQSACMAIFQENNRYEQSLSNFETEVIDINKLYSDFHVDKAEKERIKSVLYNIERAKKDIKEKERKEYLRLKKKFENN